MTAQFFVTVGGICDDARLAHLRVTIETTDGQVLSGVPESPASSFEETPEVDHTGLPPVLVVGGTTVDLESVARVVLERPEAAPEDDDPPAPRGLRAI